MSQQLVRSSPTPTLHSVGADENGQRKVYLCDHPGCNKSFGRRDYLERHAANHMSDRPHTCPICGKSYARADVLKRHVNNHPKLRYADRASDAQSNARTSMSRSTRSSTASPPPLGAPQPPSQQYPAAPPPPPAPYQTGVSDVLMPGSTMSVNIGNAVAGSSVPPAQGQGVDTDLAYVFPEPASTICGTQPTWVPIDVDGMSTQVTLDELYTWFMMTSSASGAESTNVVDETLGSGPSSSAKTFVGDLPKEEEDSTRGGPVGNAMAEAICDFVQYTLRIQVHHLTQVEMSLYTDLYFLHFDQLYPIIHRPTFHARSAPPLLYLAIVCIGSAFSSSAPHDDFHRIARAVRAHILTAAEEERRLDLRRLQALVLVNHYTRTYADTKSQHANQIYHPAVVSAMRLSGILDPVHSSFKQPPATDPVSQWHRWAEEEERSRLAWMVFVESALTATLLHHDSTMHSTAISVPLPCAEQPWTADTYTSWASQLPLPSLPQLQPTLKSYIEQDLFPSETSRFGQWVVLHGLMSLTWSLSSRGNDSYTLARKAQITAWKGSIYRSLALWHQTAMSRLSGTGNPASMPHYFTGVPYCSICIILLISDFDPIFRFAGASHIIGRDIAPKERFEARTQLESWAQASEGRQSCWFALELLQVLFRWTGETEISRLPPAILWCAYLATLVIWSYTTIVNEQPLDFHKFQPVALGTRCRVEPSLARHAALTYCDRLLASQDPLQLPLVAESSQCISLIAYMAYLCGSVRWGMISGPTEVMYNLLKHSEGRSRTFVSC